MPKHQNARIQSKSFAARTEPVDTLVLHYTELDLAASLQILRSGGVSVHYVLALDGTVYRLLEDHEVGYHAGLSQWQGRSRVNERSIGIEIVNLNGNEHPYPPQQMATLLELCKEILTANRLITPGNVVGHSDIAPKRKIDPGVKFPWQILAKAGIGLWPGDAPPAPVGDTATIQELLTRCGYPGPHAYGNKDGAWVYVPDAATPPPTITNLVPVATADILRAFQLHFQPENVRGVADPVTMGRLRKLAAMVAGGEPS